MTWIKRLWREPLLHFLLIGAGIYLFYGLFSPVEESDPDRTVRVTAGDIESLANNWQRVWNRPPTAEELDGLVRQHVREIVLYREALAMGLDKDDVVVRRRLGQKLEFLSGDLMIPPAPDTAVLETWFEENRGRYQQPDRYTVTQIYLNADERGERIRQDALAIRDELNGLGTVPDDVTGYGDPFLLQSYYPRQTESDLARLFGTQFAESVTGLTPGRWHGPVYSGYGAHVVYVNDHWRAPEPEFEQLEDRVREDWTAETSEALNKQFLEAIVARYEVVIEEANVPLTRERPTDSEEGATLSDVPATAPNANNLRVEEGSR